MFLPKQEQYELGSQIRRSADSVVSNIVGGYGRRKYKNEFERFILFSHASNDETMVHLLKIKVLYPNLAMQATQLYERFNLLGIKIFRFEKFIEGNWIKS
jgi:four helix bundle protein